MGKYLHLFNAETAFTAAYNGSDYLEPWVSYTDEDGETPHVDYNKTTGNYIKIYYDGNGDDRENYDIMEVSGDFAFEYGAPMEGAKYIFVFPDGHTQEMIVGQTYDDYNFAGTAFEGIWQGSSQSSSSDSDFFVEKPFNSAHYVSVKYENGTYYIFAQWK